jgi:hypothetical protein
MNAKRAKAIAPTSRGPQLLIFPIAAITFCLFLFFVVFTYFPVSFEGLLQKSVQSYKKDMKQRNFSHKIWFLWAFIVVFASFLGLIRPLLA